MGQLVHDQLPPNRVAVEVAAEQAGALPRTLLPRCALSVLSPVLAPKGDPDGKPIPGT
jgi:hypothetical protein